MMRTRRAEGGHQVLLADAAAPPRRSPGSRVARRARSPGARGSRVCTITRPGASPRPVRPATWATSWKVRSAARKSGRCRRGVGVDDADQRHVREVEPLGDHLRAEQDVDLAGRNAREHALVAAGRAHGVGVHARRRGLGKRCATSRLEALGADAAVVQARARGRRGRSRAGSPRRRRCGRAARRALVVRQGDVAGVALERRGRTPGSRHERVKAAAVEQQDHLAAVVEARLHGILQPRGAGRRRAARGRLLVRAGR